MLSKASLLGSWREFLFLGGGCGFFLGVLFISFVVVGYGSFIGVVVVGQASLD